jgi:DNA-binding SARP family transcriptional activator
MGDIVYRILGPLEIHRQGQPTDLRRGRPKSLLLALLLDAGKTVATTRLVEDVWGPAPPPSADQLIRVYVSQLRKDLGEEAILTRPNGYAIADASTDAADFRRLAAEGDQLRTESRDHDALNAYLEGLRLWRGTIGDDAPVEGDAAAIARQLHELRLHVLEQRFELELRLGRDSATIPELEQAVAAYPARERLVGYLMLALYRSGRQADALDLYQRTRRVLDDELGLEPGPALQRLQQEILRQDPDLDAPAVEPTGSRTRSRLLLIGAVAAAASVGAIALVQTLGAGDTPVLGADSVARIDGSTGRIETTARLHGVPGAAVVGSGQLWVVDTQHETLDELSTKDLANEASAGLTAIPHSLAYDGQTVWLADGFVGTLSRVAPDATLTPSFRPEPRSTGRLALAYGEGTLWVGSQDGAVSRLNTANGQTDAVIPGIRTPESIAVGFGAGWVAQATSVDIARIDARTNRVARRIPLGGIATSLAIHDGAVWALTPQAGQLWRIDPKKDAVSASIPVPNDGSRLVSTRDALWLISGQVGTLSRIDTRTGQIGPPIEIGHPIAGAASDADHIYVTTN